jgi:hypothetical protein
MDSWEIQKFAFCCPYFLKPEPFGAGRAVLENLFDAIRRG